LKRGKASPLRPFRSDVDLARYCGGIIDVNPEKSEGPLDLAVVAREQLHGAAWRRGASRSASKRAKADALGKRVN
jgi:hypothetical protein